MNHYTILDLAHEYFPGQIRKYGFNIYGIDTEDGSLSSLRIFVDTDTYYHYVERKFGRQEQFLRYIVGLDAEEIKGIIGEIKQNELLSLLRQVNNKQQNNSGFSLQQVVGKQGYNDYLKDERLLNQNIVEMYGIELNMDGDVFIPLHDLQKFQRVGSLVRSSTCNHKYGRYRTYMVGSHTKPHCWPGWALEGVTSDTVFIVVEGAFSLMRLQQVCLNKTSNVIPIATLTNHFDVDLFNLIHEFPLIVIGDPDDGGQKMNQQAKYYSQNGGEIEIYKPVNNIGLPLYLDEATDDELKGLLNTIYQETNFKFSFK